MCTFIQVFDKKVYYKTISMSQYHTFTLLTCLKIFMNELRQIDISTKQEQDVKLSELEMDNHKMRLELEEYRTEATHLKNQQATIRRLEERNRQLEQQVIYYFCGLCKLCFYYFYIF